MRNISKTVNESRRCNSASSVVCWATVLKPMQPPPDLSAGMKQHKKLEQRHGMVDFTHWAFFSMGRQFPSCRKQWDKSYNWSSNSLNKGVRPRQGWGTGHGDGVGGPGRWSGLGWQGRLPEKSTKQRTAAHPLLIEGWYAKCEPEERAPQHLGGCHKVRKTSSMREDWRKEACLHSEQKLA